MSKPTSTPLTNIKVFVQWTEQTVFAGEEIECQITFKNVATTPASSRTSPNLLSANSFAPGLPRKSPVSQVKAGSPLGPHSRASGKGHRSALSLNVPSGASRSQPPSSSPWGSGIGTGHPTRTVREGGPHKRSVSIISIGASEGGIDDATIYGGLAERPRGASRGHARSASLQSVPRRHGANGAPIPVPANRRSPAQLSPPFSFPPTASDLSRPERPTRRQAGIATAPGTPDLTGVPFTRRKASEPFPQAFKFPPQSISSPEERPAERFNEGSGDRESQDSEKLLSPHSKEVSSQTLNRVAATTRVLSPPSATGTPRSSGEFYSLSNNSTETLASEYVPQQAIRAPPYGGHVRRSSNLSPVNRPPETLMMGYAQIHGSFTLDASLISQTPFQEVKRKGTVGGQGGGVIGVESSRRDSGLLRSFGWGGFGESLGGLLGGGELSSMKEMREVASSRSIPLLSTPQTILFVDLRLLPGESKSYKYAFKLPRGLPPTHRGKAIKISYKLVIGTQRPGGAKEQQVTSVEIPFRLLGSVNNHGELLGHDLMSPYIILRDEARVQIIESSPFGDLNGPLEKKNQIPPKQDVSTLDDFLGYVDELLTRPRQNSSLGLLSPTEIPRSRRQSSTEEPKSARDAIDLAILRSNLTTESQQSANRFEIARGGKRVAVIMLARPAYRLGETITAVIDFTDAAIPCYAIHSALETSERVDSSIALRSEASILRVTRKVYASHSESTLFARRVVFAPTIPISATPEFMTTGVSLDWRLRIEFVTPQLDKEDSEGEGNYTELLEEISRDDRGVVIAACETLDCESFDIAVPLQIYGAVVSNTEKEENLLDGLVV